VLENPSKVVVLTSTLKRTVQTAKYLKLNEIKPIPLRILDEINAGVCEHLTYGEIKLKFQAVAQ
jgi:broad specificity phosphatase PhoE